MFFCQYQARAKEFQGQLFKVLDHDFPSWVDDVIILHGLFDSARNRGHIDIGLPHDTVEFACDSFKWYRNCIERQVYPEASSVLLLVDGGSNFVSKYIFRHELQAVVNAIGMEVRIARYPGYCSKYNLIEQRWPENWTEL